MIATYEYNGTAYTINLERLADGRYQATIGDRTVIFDAQSLGDGLWQINLNGERTNAHTASQGNTRFVALNGQSFTLTQPERRANRRGSTGAGGGDLTAQMPGQVTEVHVQEGDRVERGQTLVILEAMKMEIRVTAPADGEIKRLLVKAGDIVERGQSLVHLE